MIRKHPIHDSIISPFLPIVYSPLSSYRLLIACISVAGYSGWFVRRRFSLWQYPAAADIARVIRDNGVRELATISLRMRYRGKSLGIFTAGGEKRRGSFLLATPCSTWFALQNEPRYPRVRERRFRESLAPFFATDLPPFLF